MLNKDAEILFNFLKDILFTQRSQNLNITILSKEFQDLGEGLNVLSKYVDELREYSQHLNDGDFGFVNESSENQLLWGLKTFQSDVSHLMWQADKIVEGDLTQRTNKLGALGKSFNALADVIYEKDARIKELEKHIDK